MNTRILGSLATATVALVLAVSPVAAANPHFVSAIGTISTSPAGYTVAFKVAGLGNQQQGTVTLGGSFTADWKCLNPGGNKPPGHYHVEDTINVSGDFGPADDNGQITDEIDATMTLACPRPMEIVEVEDISVSGPWLQWEDGDHFPVTNNP